MKFKDYVTLGNLAGGFGSVIALFQGSFEWACYLIYIAYVFDILDGPAARLTKQYDRFGGFLDEVCDFVTNSIATSFIIYYAFWKLAGFPFWLAALIAFFPVAMGTIRQARSMDKAKSYPCYWVGLPRPVLALASLAVLNSSAFMLYLPEPWQTVKFGVLAAVIVLLSMMHVSSWVFGSHHDRRFMTGMRFGSWFFLGGSFVVWLAGLIFLGRPELVYDHLLFCFLIYMGLSWTQYPREDRRRIKVYMAGGPLIMPLVHKKSDWRSKGIADYFEAHRKNPGPADDLKRLEEAEVELGLRPAPEGVGEE